MRKNVTRVFAVLPLWLPFSIWPRHSTARASTPSTKNFEIDVLCGHVCGPLPVALEVHFENLIHIFAIISNCCVGTVSAYALQEFRAVQETDDPDDAQLDGSYESKRGTLQANTSGRNLFLNMSMSGSVFLCRHFPDSPRKRRIVDLDPRKAPGPPGISFSEQALAFNLGDGWSLAASSPTLCLTSLVSAHGGDPKLFAPCLTHHDARNHAWGSKQHLSHRFHFAIAGVSPCCRTRQTIHHRPTFTLFS